MVEKKIRTATHNLSGHNTPSPQMRQALQAPGHPATLLVKLFLTQWLYRARNVRLLPRVHLRRARNVFEAPTPQSRAGAPCPLRPDPHDATPLQEKPFPLLSQSVNRTDAIHVSPPPHPQLHT